MHGLETKTARRKKSSLKANWLQVTSIGLIGLHSISDKKR